MATDEENSQWSMVNAFYEKFALLKKIKLFSQFCLNTKK